VLAAPHSFVHVRRVVEYPPTDVRVVGRAAIAADATLMRGHKVFYQDRNQPRRTVRAEDDDLATESLGVRTETLITYDLVLEVPIAVFVMDTADGATEGAVMQYLSS